MTGCYGNSPEDRYFENMLHKHLEVEDREEETRDKAEFLMSKGQKCYPWSHENILEALENRNDEMFLTSCITAGAEINQGECSLAWIGGAVKNSIFNYWKDCATKKAIE